MPWYSSTQVDKYVSEEERDILSQGVLHMHVPRSGGTSLLKGLQTRSFSIKAQSSWIAKLGVMYFWYTYKVGLQPIHRNNITWMRWENLFSLLQTATALILYLLYPGLWAYFLTPFIMGIATILFSTILQNPAGFAHFRWLRYFSAILSGMIQDVMCSKVHLVGASGSEGGAVQHMTVRELLRCPWLEETMKESIASSRIPSFALVRNPYARMVSVYYRDRFYYENFEDFVRNVAQKQGMFLLETKDSPDDVREKEHLNVWCHFQPAVAYTHDDKSHQQFVTYIVKTEWLKFLSNEDCENGEIDYPDELHSIPGWLKRMLADMPRENVMSSEKGVAPWNTHYTVETRDIVWKLWNEDFVKFGYSKDIPNRSDLCT